jgi:hypothetical protein
MMQQNHTMTRVELEHVREWAIGKLATGEEPPWAWYQYMKLRETLDALLAGMDAVMPQTESSPREVPRQGKHLRLVGPTSPQDSAQRHPSGEPVQMPM